MDSRYAEVYRDLYRRHWWWRAREAAIESRIAALSLPANARILDVGCGDALFFDRLERYGTVEGLEADASLPSPATLARHKIYVQPFDRDFAPGDTYHLVLMLDILEHLPDPLAALRLAHELLRPRGVLLVTVPAYRALWTSHDEFNHHLTRYHPRTLRRELEEAGFAVEDLRALFLWPVLGKLLVMLKEKVFRGEAKPASVPPGWMNATLLALTRADVATGLRFRLPWGSSLLAQARARREGGA